MTDDVALKPCPFCGHESVEVFHHPDRGTMIGESWHVECLADACGNGTCHHETEAWNHRATDAKIKALVEAVGELVDACELPGEHCEIEQALPRVSNALAAFEGGV
jgi:hypothetical protein